MESIHNLIKDDFGTNEDFNCAEKILYGANKAYDLKLTKEALKLSAGFGGGMGIESICGALTGAIMVLSHVFVDDYAHENETIKEKTSEFLEQFNLEMTSINCNILKEKYRTDDTKCKYIIQQSAIILDKIVNGAINER